MSKLFYDNLLDFDEIKKAIDDVVKTIEEKEELWKIVDEIIHHRVLTCILDNLDPNNHSEFIEYYHEKPHDEAILLFLKRNIDDDFEQLIVNELEEIKKEVLSDIKG